MERRGDAVALLPGIAAIGLAILYATGALLKSGQLRGEGLRVRDTLTLVPLEQILALGIGTVVNSLLWLAVVGFTLGAVTAALRRGLPSRIHVVTRIPERTAQRSGRRVRWLRSLFVLWLVAISATFLWVAPIYVAVPSIASMWFAIIVTMREVRGRVFFTLFAAYFFVILAARIGQAFVAPDPLPTAELRLTQGEIATGTLIVATGDGWYISRRESTFRLVPAERVRLAIVRSRERKERRPVIRALWEEIYERWGW